MNEVRHLWRNCTYIMKHTHKFYSSKLFIVTFKFSVRSINVQLSTLKPRKHCTAISFLLRITSSTQTSSSDWLFVIRSHYERGHQSPRGRSSGGRSSAVCKIQWRMALVLVFDNPVETSPLSRIAKTTDTQSFVFSRCLSSNSTDMNCWRFLKRMRKLYGDSMIF